MEVLANEPIVAYGNVGSATKFRQTGNSNPPGKWSTRLAQSEEINENALELLVKLESFSNLADNWDSYGASKPSAIAMKRASHFLRENHYLALPFYFIAPGVNGEIMLECKAGEKAAEIYFNEDGTNELLLFEKNETQLEGDLSRHFSALIQFFND